MERHMPELLPFVRLAHDQALPGDDLAAGWLLTGETPFPDPAP